MSNFYTLDGFQFFRKTSKDSDILGDRLVIENNKLAKTVNYINVNRIKAITINPFISTVDNLSFLEELPFVEGLYLLQNDLDIFPINNLKELRALHLNKLDSSIDFDNLKNLEVLGCTFHKELKNIHCCSKLFWLWIDNFKLPNLTSLSALENLKYLNLYKTSIVNLSGISSLKNLCGLLIDSAPKLVSLEGFDNSNYNLSSLDISNARHLVSYYEISKLKNISKVYFYKTGACQDLSFINNLNSLTEFVHGGKHIKKAYSELASNAIKNYKT